MHHSLIFFNRTTLHQILTTEKESRYNLRTDHCKTRRSQTGSKQVHYRHRHSQSNINRMKQKQQTATQKKTKEKAEIPEEASSKPSVFSQNSTSASSDSSAGVFSSDAETDGHIIGIDPGHQSESVDMSAPEPNGPGSSEMKAKCTSGTQGTYSGVPEYQLNLEVSLQLKDELEQRGYQVVMTRTDNETAISNMERAQYAAAQAQRSMSASMQTAMIPILHQEH